MVLKEDQGVLALAYTNSHFQTGLKFVNIRKYVRMGASSNFGNMFSMLGASIFVPFLPMAHQPDRDSNRQRGCRTNRETSTLGY